jgi:hypothetical protein
MLSIHQAIRDGLELDALTGSEGVSTLCIENLALVVLGVDESDIDALLVVQELGVTYSTGMMLSEQG